MYLLSKSGGGTPFLFNFIPTEPNGKSGGGGGGLVNRSLFTRRRIGFAGYGNTIRASRDTIIINVPT